MKRETKIQRQREFQEALAVVKKNPCSVCTRLFPIECMDMDHVDPSTKVRPGGTRSNRAIAYGGVKSAEKLLSTCKVICSNCHRVRTETERHYGEQLRTGGSTKAARKSRKKADKVKRIIRELKQGPCKDCNESFPPCAMDFDHVDGKSIQVSEMIRMKSSLDAIQREIAKCELVCSNCHRIRTKNRREITQGGHRSLTGLWNAFAAKSADCPS